MSKNTNSALPARVRTIKCCDLDGTIAAQLFALLNPTTVTIDWSEGDAVIVTNVDPDQLTYPEGWYYAKGCLRNQHTSTTGVYSEVAMVDSAYQPWGARIQG